jgi:hypothetical protein
MGGHFDLSPAGGRVLVLPSEAMEPVPGQDQRAAETTVRSAYDFVAHFVGVGPWSDRAWAARTSGGRAYHGSSHTSVLDAVRTNRTDQRAALINKRAGTTGWACSDTLRQRLRATFAPYNRRLRRIVEEHRRAQAEFEGRDEVAWSWPPWLALSTVDADQDHMQSFFREL